MTTETKKETLICVILDESGSMATKKADIIGGYNQFLRDQKALTVDQMRLSLTKFNTLCSTVYSAMPVAGVPELTEATYVPGGMTALFDAIAESVRLADKQTVDRVICLIITDGLENSSRETTKDQVVAIIKERTDRGSWSFVYLGEDPERWAHETGTSVRNTAQYNHAAPGASFATASAGIEIARRQSGNQFDDVLDPDKKAEA